MQLYEIPSAVRYALEHGTDPDTGELTDVGVQLLAEAELSLEERIDSYCAIIRELEAEENAYEREEFRLSELRKTAFNKAERMRELIRAAMEATGKKKIETGRFKARIQRNGQPSIDVPNLNMAPPEVVKKKEVVTVDRTLILEWIKAGVDVSGWAHVEHGSHLRIA